MSLNESIVENAVLEWLGELGYAVGHGPDMAPGEAAAERDFPAKAGTQCVQKWSPCPCVSFIELSADRSLWNCTRGDGSMQIANCIALAIQ